MGNTVSTLPIATVSAAEQRMREDLAAAYRLVALYGMDDSIYTHISARVPGTEDRFLINPFGMLFRDITASSLVCIDLSGRIISAPPGCDVNPAGFTIHSAVHAARHDATCVLHTHTVAGVAVSSLACGLKPANQWALQFHERVAYHDFEGIALDLDERERLVADLGPEKRALIQASGETVYDVPEAVREKTARQYEGGDTTRRPGQPDPYAREWAALLQRLEPASASSYRD
jgi:ribulose-5-phosphate 4-epimerase/fuculose-1-phosphate aldolase